MGSRATGEGAERVYDAAALWLERALRTDDSLFMPGKQIWSRKWLESIRERFLEQPEYSGDDFLDKLKGQLGPTGPPTGA